MAEEYLTSKDDAITVPFSDDQAAEAEPDDKGEDLPANATPAQLSEAKRKRHERGRQREEERRRERERADALEQELSTLKQELARTQGYLAAQAQQPRERDSKDPYQEKLDAIESERANAYAAAQAEIKAGTMDEKRSKHYEQLGRDLEERRVNTLVERQLTRAQATAAARRPAEEAQALYRAKYPDIYQSPKAYAYASAEWQKRTQALGQQPTDELLDEVMNEARTQFKLGPKPQASATERARMSGIPSSGNGGGGGKGGDSFTFSNEKVRAMAVAAYSHLPEKEALKAWAQKTGKKLRDRKVL